MSEMLAVWVVVCIMLCVRYAYMTDCYVVVFDFCNACFARLSALFLCSLRALLFFQIGRIIYFHYWHS